MEKNNKEEKEQKAEEIKENKNEENIEKTNEGSTEKKLDTEKENKQKSSAKLSKSEISNLKAIALILMAVIVFLMFSQQIFTTIILFAKQHVNNILPIINSQISPSLYVSINPLFIIILTPIYLKLFHKLSEKNMAVNTYTKIGIGLLLTGIAFLVLFIATPDLNANTKINMV